MNATPIWPDLEKGDGALKAASADWRDFCVVTTPSPWRFAQPHLPEPRSVIFAENLNRKTLETLATQMGDSHLVVGVGSGLAMDAAKYLAKARQTALAQVPSTSSNNACFTRTAWTFEGGARIPEREVPIPLQIVLDYDLLRSAPDRMNRAGAAEILCSHTALFDWRLAHESGVDVQWDDDLEQSTREELAALEDYAPEIGANDRDAFVRIIEVGAKFSKGFTTHPKARFNAGSEHILAWGLEEAGNRVIHGEAVSLSILLMAHMQGNNPEFAADVIKSAQINYRPDQLGLSWDDVEKTVLALPQTAKRVPWHTIINDFEKCGAQGARDLADRFKAAKEFVRRLH
jgi:glycerol-1-phosphate dehydrogenase [NAD(P)+]